MNTISERYCAISESIEESSRQIKEYNEGKRKLASLKDSKDKWNQWIQENDDIQNNDINEESIYTPEEINDIDYLLDWGAKVGEQLRKRKSL